MSANEAYTITLGFFMVGGIIAAISTVVTTRRLWREYEHYRECIARGTYPEERGGAKLDLAIYLLILSALVTSALNGKPLFSVAFALTGIAWILTSQVNEYKKWDSPETKEGETE